MGGLVVIILWIVMIAACAALGKYRQVNPAPNRTLQKTAQASSVKNISNGQSTAQSSRRASRNTAQNGQNTSQSTVQSSSGTRQRTAGNSQKPAGHSQSMTKYSRMGSKREGNTGRKSQTLYQQKNGQYNQKPSALEEDILARANRNTQQQFADDVLEQGQKDIHNSSMVQQPFSVEESTDLMKEIFDLMIVGPDTSTYYGRDFVAEGVEMVNRSLESL